MSTNDTAEQPEYDYYGNSNADLLNIIPANARKVFEFGCGQVRLAADYKTRNPLARYIAVEKEAEAAEVARKIVDTVVCDNAEDPAVVDRLLAAHGPGDVLVYGDTLEHFVDPWATFEAHLRLLEPDGVVCVCIPNSQHWGLSVALMAGRMEYQDSGLRDRTHLHLFTRSSIQNFLERFGLTITKVRDRKFGSPPKSVPKIAEVIAAATKLKAKDVFDGMTTLQYVVQATRRPPSRKWFIDWRTVKQLGGFNHIRVKAPATFVQTLPSVTVVTHEKTANIRHAPGQANLFIWQRPILVPETDLESIRKLQRNRKLVITDFDDDPDIWPKIAENRHLSFVGVHAVQVSNDRLREKIAAFNPHTFVVPNRLPAVKPYPLVREKTIEHTMFVGGFNRAPDFEPIAEAVNTFLDTDSRPWHVYILGDERIAGLLRTDRKEFHKIIPYKQYQTLLEKADIALLPLNDTPSNHYKSNLKFLEAAAAAAVVFAGTPVYSETIEHGRTGFLFETPDDLLSQLRSIGDRSTLERVRAAAHEAVQRDAMLSPVFAETLDIYYDLYDRFDALNAELNERLESLRFED